jgi:spore germination protein GerM
MRRRAWLLVLAVLASCGAPHDSGPRDIPSDQQGEMVTPAPPPAGDPSATGPKVYLVAATDDALQPVARDVPLSANALLEELLRGPTTDERDRRIRTAVPTGTELRSTLLDGDGTLVVDLTEAFFGAEGDAQVTAVAQVVFTAVGVDGVQAVRLLVEGQRRDWPRGDGSLESEPLTEFDYPELNPTSQPEYPPIPPAAS